MMTQIKNEVKWSSERTTVHAQSKTNKIISRQIPLDHCYNIHKEQIAQRQCPFKVNDKKKNLCAIQSGIPESVFCENSENVSPEMMRCFSAQTGDLCHVLSQSPWKQSLWMLADFLKETLNPPNHSSLSSFPHSFKPYCTLACSNKTKGLDIFFLNGWILCDITRSLTTAYS